MEQTITTSFGEKGGFTLSHDRYLYKLDMCRMSSLTQAPRVISLMDFEVLLEVYLLFWDDELIVSC